MLTVAKLARALGMHGAESRAQRDRLAFVLALGCLKRGALRGCFLVARNERIDAVLYLVEHGIAPVAHRFELRALEGLCRRAALAGDWRSVTIRGLPLVLAGPLDVESVAVVARLADRHVLKVKHRQPARWQAIGG